MGFVATSNYVGTHSYILPTLDLPAHAIHGGAQGSMYFNFVTGKSSDILSDISSDIRSGILSGISSGILFGILSGISSGISSDILSGKHSGTLSGIPSGTLSGISSGIWSRRRRRRRARALKKSNNPHLAGGEKRLCVKDVKAPLCKNDKKSLCAKALC